MFLITLISLLLPTPLAAQTCPALSFLRAADVPLIGGSYSQGFLSGLERLADGSQTLYKFTGNTSTYQQSTTPQYQSNFYSCIGLPPRGSSPPVGWRFLADAIGISSMNPVLTDLTGTGLSAGVALDPYSLTRNKLQVWLATANKTPGARATYDIPQNPESLLSADLNNDGKRDIILVSQGVFANSSSQGVVSVFLGNGDGTLGARRDTPSGNGSQSVAAWDFNADGKLDLAVANGGGSNVTILPGNGDGTFQTPVTLPGDAGYPRGVAAADLNKDGKGDLVVGHGSGVDIRLGNGNGTFQTSTRILSGPNISYVATGDFNKDGNVDIVAASSLSALVIVMLGNGAGGFTVSSSYVTRYNARQMLVYDFDWDGNPDIVFGGGHPDALAPEGYQMNVAVLFGRGNGTFHGVPALVFPSLRGMTVGDFNGDGKADVVTTGYPSTGQPYNLNVSLNNGNGILQTPTPISVQAQGSPAYLTKIASADFNGDGRRDVAVSNGATIFTLLGNGNGTFQTPAPFAAGADISAISTADFNGDSKTDLIYTDRNENKVYVALGNGNGTFQTRAAVATGQVPVDVSAVDLNGDGKIDLVVVYNGSFANGNDPGGIAILLGNGNGTFQAPISYAAGLNPTYVSVGDINGDGRPDLVVSTSGANFAMLADIYLGNGNGTFQAPTMQTVDFGPAQAALADFDGDGKVDILMGHCCGDVTLGVLVGNGNGTFQTEVNLAGAGTGGSYVTAVDLNQDGKMDALFAGDTYVGTLLNNSGGVILSDCTFTLNRSTASASALGDTVGVNVTASQPSCSWNAQSNAAWITFGGSLPRSGTAALRLAVAANTGGARSATITIANQTFTVSQAASGCGFGLDPATLSATGATASFNLTVTTQAGCAWSANATSDWVSLTGGNSNTGSGIAPYTLAANATGSVRTASISVAGEYQQIIQSAASPAQQFDDVAVSHPFYNFISLMRTRAITSGCSAISYCPDALTTRGQMAVFIIRAIFGGDTFTYPSGPYFSDVAAAHPFFKWIQKMRELGITTGCTANTYCPDDAVTRGQMAVFVVRARLGLAGGDPLVFPGTAFFGDVPTSHAFFGFIQKMRQLAVTSGCTSSTYCPDGNTTRGQMSVFIVRGLLTP